MHTTNSTLATREATIHTTRDKKRTALYKSKSISKSKTTTVSIPSSRRSNMKNTVRALLGRVTLRAGSTLIMKVNRVHRRHRNSLSRARRRVSSLSSRALKKGVRIWILAKLPSTQQIRMKMVINRIVLARLFKALKSLSLEKQQKSYMAS